MTSRHFALTALLAAVLVPAAVAGPNANSLLIGKVGFHNAFRITLTFTNGRPVKTIPAGTYTLVVHDYSKIHNFALGSQTENKRLLTTGVAWIGTRTYHLKLTPGHYAYACSVHYQTMSGTFIATSAP